MPESSASAGSLAAVAAARAFSSALAMNVSPVSSGSGRPSAAAESTSAGNAARSSAISRTLPLLWLATISLPPSKRRIALEPDRRQRGPLLVDEFGDAALRQRQQREELLL